MIEQYITSTQFTILKKCLDSNPFSAEHANTGNGLSSHCPQSAFQIAQSYGCFAGLGEGLGIGLGDGLGVASGVGLAVGDPLGLGLGLGIGIGL